MQLHFSEERLTRRSGFPLALMSIVMLSLASLKAWAGRTEEVWFTPGDDTPDLIELFRNVELWSKARAQIDVFKFGPRLLTARASVKRNSYEELVGVGAFSKLRAWGIKIASEEGAIKPWDCTGIKAAQITRAHMRNVQAAGGELTVIAMDEPLKSGRDVCHLPAIDVARRTAAYAQEVGSGDGAEIQTKKVIVGDIEPYPAVSVGEFEEWTDALIGNGFKPAFVHVDINGHFVDVHPEVNMDKDMQALQAFFRRKGIPFGVILWSGYSPLNSDRAYYDHTMRLVRATKKALGQPDEVIFESWVQRSPKDCQESDQRCSHKLCSQGDPSYCGDKSIPLNLPEGEISSFSHTRLINDALAELDASCCHSPK